MMKKPRSVTIQDAEILAARRARSRKIRHNMRRSLAIGGLGLVVSAVIAAQTGIWQGWMAALDASVTEYQARISDELGLKIHHVYLEGRQRLPMDEAQAIVGVKLGTPLMSVDIAAIRNRLMENPWVLKAEVQRSLSGALHINITERQPVAIWQHDDRHFLVDKFGTMMVPVSEAPDHDPLLESLPLLIGASAPQHWQGLLEQMAQTPSIFARVHSAVWVGERRWDLVLFDGTRIMLPQDDVEKAWQMLTRLEHDGVFEKAIAGLDLRDPEKLYIRLKDVDSLASPTESQATPVKADSDNTSSPPAADSGRASVAI